MHVFKTVLSRHMALITLNFAKIVHKHALRVLLQQSAQFARVQQQWRLIKCVIRFAIQQIIFIITTRVLKHVQMELI